MQNSQGNTWTGVSFSKSSSLETCNFIKTETPIQVFFCEFWKSFKNTYFLVHLRTTASENWSIKNKSTVRSLLYRIAGFLVTVSICSKKVTRSLLILVKCIKLYENKTPHRTSIRGYSETFSYSRFFMPWSSHRLKRLISRTVIPFE